MGVGVYNMVWPSEIKTFDFSMSIEGSRIIFEEFLTHIILTYGRTVSGTVDVNNIRCNFRINGKFINIEFVLLETYNGFKVYSERASFDAEISSRKNKNGLSINSDYTLKIEYSKRCEYTTLRGVALQLNTHSEFSSTYTYTLGEWYEQESSYGAKMVLDQTISPDTNIDTNAKEYKLNGVDHHLKFLLDIDTNFNAIVILFDSIGKLDEFFGGDDDVRLNLLREHLVIMTDVSAHIKTMKAKGLIELSKKAVELILTKSPEIKLSFEGFDGKNIAFKINKDSLVGTIMLPTADVITFLPMVKQINEITLPKEFYDKLKFYHMSNLNPTYLDIDDTLHELLVNMDL